MASVYVRYMVHDVDAAIAFYTKHVGFTLLSSAAPAFAEVGRLRAAGVRFRNDIVRGPGGSQILLEILSQTRSNSSNPRAGSRRDDILCVPLT